MHNPQVHSAWHPDAWRDCRAAQMPDYADPGAVAAVEADLSARPPLVDYDAIVQLRHELAAAAAGQCALLQAGDCAESFADNGADKVARTHSLLQDLGAILGAAAPVITTGRIAGQFAKPRSQSEETRNGQTLPVYRGDSINDFAFTASARAADPQRMITAYRQAAATLAHLPVPLPFYTCHEALLLPYETGLTRRDEQSGNWYGGSAHFLWLGARTQDLDGAHTAWLRGIINPIGIKCAPWTNPDDLLRLLDILDPDNMPGRITLIPRLGIAAIDDRLPLLLSAVRRTGRSVLWCCDPMHGNTIMTAGGRKTRRMADIKNEITRFVALHREHGTFPGGLHIEMSANDVTECLDRQDESSLNARYETRCDPRLNAAQAKDIVRYFTDNITGTGAGG